MTAPAKAADATKVVTGEVRLSYCWLLQPRKGEDENERDKYGCTILVPKSDKATIAKINKAIEAAKEQGKKSKWGGKVPKNLKVTFRDGDEEKDLDEQPEYKGMMFMSVSSNTRPGLVGRDLSPLTSEDEVYSGMYARVAIAAAPFDFNGSKGVTFYLNHVQKLRDGENLAGRSKPEDVFEALDEAEGDGDDSLI
jgi:hypothetical protein